MTVEAYCSSISMTAFDVTRGRLPEGVLGDTFPEEDGLLLHWLCALAFCVLTRLMM